MAITQGAVWEVRTAGSDTNGGGCATTVGTTTDYSQSNTKNTSGNNQSTTDAITAATTTLTSATASFTSAIIGNIIYLAGGSGSLTGAWYQVTARTNSTTVTIDRAPGVSTGVTMNIGGALATIGQAFTNAIAGNKIFVKADGTYAPTASQTWSVTSAVPDKPANYVIGYTTSRIDGGRVTVQATTNTGITVFNFASGNGIWLRNFIIDCNSLGTSIGVALGLYCNMQNCTVKNFTTSGVKISADDTVIADSEITAGTSAATAAIDQAASGRFIVNHCYIHDNVCPGIAGTPANNAGVSITNNLIVNNTGASSDGAQIRYGFLVLNNTFYANGRDGLRITVQYTGLGSIIRNNIFVNNGGYGFNQSTTPANAPGALWDGNAYYNNTSGARNNLDTTTISSTINDGVSPYINSYDVTLTGVPFTNAGGGDFSLNNTASQGAACRAAGIPGATITGGTANNPFLGSSTSGYLDMGAVQHADPAALFPRSRIFTGF